MSDNPRRWFQIHLSTAIVLMFVAGGASWLNVQITIEKIVYVDKLEPNATYEDFAIPHSRGWPLIYLKEMHALPWHSGIVPLKTFYLGAVVINLSIALVILAAVAGVCEWILRRREARAP